jgi:hypothetical protein
MMNNDKTFTIKDYKPASFQVRSLTVYPSLYFGGSRYLDSNYFALTNNVIP